MKVYIVHVAYEPTILGVFSSRAAAEWHLDNLAKQNEYPKAEMWVKEYEVEE